MEEVKVLQVDTSQADSNVNKLTNDVGKLNGSLDKAGNNIQTTTNKISAGFKSADTAMKAMQNTNKATTESIKTLSGVLGSAGGSLGKLNGVLTVMNSGLASTPAAFKGLTSGIGAATKASLKFIATPIGAVIMAIVVAVKAAMIVWDKLSEAIKKNDNASTALSRLYEVTVQPVVNLVTKAFDGLATIIGKVANFMTNLIGGTNAATDATNSLVLATDNLEEAERQYITNSAERQKQISELRAKAADKESYSAKERQQFLQEAIDLETQNLEDEKKIKAERLRLLEEEAKRNADTSDETKNKIAQARADLINAETNYNNTVRKLNKELTTAKKEDAAEQKAIDDAAAAKAKEKSDAEAKAKAEELAKSQEALNIRLEQNKRLEQSETERLQNELTIEKERLGLLQEGTLGYEQQLTKISEIESKIKESLTPDLSELQKNLESLRDEQDTEELSPLEKIQSEEDEKLAILQQAYENGLIAEEEYENRKTQVQEDAVRQRTELAKSEQKAVANAGVSLLSGMASLGKNIASIFSDESEEAFEAQKAFEISSAVIETLTGAIKAYTGAAGNSGINAIPIVGPAIAQAMGITNAAVVAAGGAAQIAEISKRKFKDKSTNVTNKLSSGGASNVSASATAATIMPPTQYSQAVQGAEIETSLRDTRVYVTEGDIADTSRKVNVQEAENRY